MKTWIKVISREKIIIIDLLCLIIGILVVCYIFQTYTIKEIWYIVINWNANREWSDKWYGLFAIYWFEVILVAFIWDLLWLRLKYVFNFFIWNLHNMLLTGNGYGF